MADVEPLKLDSSNNVPLFSSLVCPKCQRFKMRRTSINDIPVHECCNPACGHFLTMAAVRQAKFLTMVSDI